MAQIWSFAIFLLISSTACFDMGFDDDFFNDFDTKPGDKRSLTKGEKDSSSDDSYFLSESTNTLDDGREMITRESKAWVKDTKTGQWIEKMSTRHFIRYQNGTVVEVEDDGSGDVKTDGEVTKVDCIAEDDCKDDFFCDRLSYRCEACLKINTTCHRHRECCEGSMCRQGKCEAITGKEDDPCESDKDCQSNHCCAFDKGREVCKPFLKKGDECGEQRFSFSRFPSLFASRFLQEERKTRCPCLKGLQCRKQDTFFMYKPKYCVETKTKKYKKKWKKSKRKQKKQKCDDIEEVANENEDERMNSTEEDLIGIADDDDDDDDDMEDQHEREARNNIEDEHDIEDDHDDEGDDDDDDDDDFDQKAKKIIGNIPRLLKDFVQGFFGSV